MITCPNCGEENPAKFRLCGFCGTPLAAPVAPQEVRKLVTILFCDLKGSTSLGEAVDPESLREIMTSYFDAMSAAIRSHGGTIEKYIGDAVMAVFGLPRVHEDDALRAVRAAAAMQAALDEINGSLEARYGVRLANRIGVNTGEVVAGDATTGQRLVTGDAVNVAARLEQAAGECEVLLGDLTYRVVRDDVEVEPVEPLELKGKAQRVPAFRLVSLRTSAEKPLVQRPLVGRREELDVLTSELDVAARESWPRLVTILAEPGVGKSRLLAEFAAQTAKTAGFVTGRCLSYGRGITFWPLTEIARSLAGVEDDDSQEEGMRKLLELAAGDTSIAERLGAVMGLAERQFALEETFWATQRALELASADRPLVVCFEDIHWAEQALLDLIEHLVGSPRTARILIICAARPTLLEIRPGWEARGRAIALEPLSIAESEELVREALDNLDIPSGVLAQIVEAAAGNPLYVSQIVSMLVDEGTLRREGGRWVTTRETEIKIPPTIQALLAARLDLLGDGERSVVESASVIGHIFAQAAVEELVPDPVRPVVETHLTVLGTKRLVHREPSLEEPHYRFDHILIRDAAYQSLLKRTRATLHERFVEWAERVNAARDRSAEYDDILGYHLEQAHVYLSELGPLDDHGRSLGIRGSEKLAAAGRRAFARGDMSAAANLLRRAAALRSEDDPERARLLPMLAEAMMEIGEFAWAETTLDDAERAAGKAGDARLLDTVALTRLYVQHRAVDDLTEWREHVLTVTARLLPELERVQAHDQLAKAWRLIAIAHAITLERGREAEAAERAIAHAREARDERLETRVAAGYTNALRDGPTPVPEAIERCRAILDRRLSNRQAEAVVRGSLAMLLAMDEELDEARSEYAAAIELLSDLGGALPAYAAVAAAKIELAVGNYDAVIQELRPAYIRLGELGEHYFRPVVGGMLALALQEEDESAEAKALVNELAESTDSSDVEAWSVLHAVRAKQLAADGAYDEAIAAARLAVDVVAEADAPVVQANALVALAEIADAAGDPQLARETRAAAAERYAAKADAAALTRLGVRASEPV